MQVFYTLEYLNCGYTLGECVCMDVYRTSIHAFKRYFYQLVTLQQIPLRIFLMFN